MQVILSYTVGIFCEQYAIVTAIRQMHFLYRKKFCIAVQHSRHGNM